MSDRWLFLCGYLITLNYIFQYNIAIEIVAQFLVLPDMSMLFLLGQEFWSAAGERGGPPVLIKFPVLLVVASLFYWRDEAGGTQQRFDRQHPHIFPSSSPHTPFPK